MGNNMSVARKRDTAPQNGEKMESNLIVLAKTSASSWKSFTTHQEIIEGISPKFKQIAVNLHPYPTSSSKPKLIFIEDIEAKQLDKILKYSVGLSTELKGSMVWPLRAVAVKYHIHDLIYDIDRILLKNLNVDNFCRTFSRYSKVRDLKLQYKCIEKLKSLVGEHEEILDSEFFFHLKFEDIRILLQSHFLDVEKEFLWRKCFEWTFHQDRINQKLAMKQFATSIEMRFANESYLAHYLKPIEEERPLQRESRESDAKEGRSILPTSNGDDNPIILFCNSSCLQRVAKRISDGKVSTRNNDRLISLYYDRPILCNSSFEKDILLTNNEDVNCDNPIVFFYHQPKISHESCMHTQRRTQAALCDSDSQIMLKYGASSRNALKNNGENTSGPTIDGLTPASQVETQIMESRRSFVGSQEEIKHKETSIVVGDGSKQKNSGSPHLPRPKPPEGVEKHGPTSSTKKYSRPPIRKKNSGSEKFHNSRVAEVGAQKTSLSPSVQKRSMFIDNDFVPSYESSPSFPRPKPPEKCAAIDRIRQRSLDLLLQNTKSENNILKRHRSLDLILQTVH